MTKGVVTHSRYYTTVGMRWLNALVVPAAVVVALFLYQPPGPVPGDDYYERFSAERAFTHVEAIATVSRPFGSAAQGPALDYIRAEVKRIGYEPFEQDPPPRLFLNWGLEVRNVAVRVEGTDSTGAVLLMAHHDSRWEGPGAADDAAGVATLLETMRALKTGDPPRNDIIFLFTDGEELGLYGAKSFVQGAGPAPEPHPWAKDVKVVMNFDGRGGGGPVMVPQAANANAWLIAQLQAAAPYPLANSLMQDVYKAMPNDTDLTPFVEEGYAGINFNFIDDYPRYHSVLDVPEGLSLATLQHWGEYALPLTRHFGSLDLAELPKHNAHYLNPAGYWLVAYPSLISYVLLVVVILLYCGVYYLGMRNTHVRFGHTALGFLYFLLIGAAIVAGAAGFGYLLQFVHGREFYWVINAYLGVLTGLAIAIFALAVAFLRVWYRAQDLVMGALFAWVIIAIAVVFVAPGASPLVQWPIIATLLVLAIHFTLDDFEDVSTGSAVAIAALSVFLVLMFTPNIIALNLAAANPLTYATIGAPVVLVVLLLGLAVPALAMIVETRSWALPAAAAGIAVAFFVYAAPMADVYHERAMEQAVGYSGNEAVQTSLQSEGQSQEELEAQIEKALAVEAKLHYYDGLPMMLYRGESLDTATKLAAMAETAYRRDRDLDLYLFLARSGIYYCLWQARDKTAGNLELEQELKRRARAIASHLALNTWPGRTPAHVDLTAEAVEAGADAAVLNLALAQELELPQDDVAEAQWLTGAHHLAAGELDVAKTAFQTAADTAERPEKIALYQGYAVLVDAAPAGDYDAVDQRADALVGAYGLDALDDADELRQAFRVFATRDIEEDTPPAEPATEDEAATDVDPEPADEPPAPEPGDDQPEAEPANDEAGETPNG